jgi:hypothetical protein
VSSLNVSGCTGLTELHCGSTQLTSLNVSSCSALEYLNCEWSQLTGLNVSGCTALEELRCSGNQLTTLNIYYNTALSYLDLSWMTSLYDVCVWELPFPPASVEANTDGSTNINFTTDCPVSIPDVYEANSMLDIYPNPSYDIINIKVENTNNASIEIYNVSGIPVFSKAIDSKTEKIDLTGFPEGVYIIKLTQPGTVNFGKLVVK